MLEVIYDGIVSGNEASQRAETLGERAHNEIHLVGEAEVTGGPGAVFAYDAQTVRVIYHKGSIVLFAQLHHFWNRSNVSFHRINSIHDNQLGCIGRNQLEFGFQGIHVIVCEFANLGKSQPASVYYAGMVKGIEECVSSSEPKATYDTEVYLKSGAVRHCCIFAYKFCKFGFELFMDVKSSVQETAA